MSYLYLQRTLTGHPRLLRVFPRLRFDFAHRHDNPGESAHVLATLTHDTNGNGVFECGGADNCWTNFGGDTDANGNRPFKLVGGAPSGLYQAKVTGLTHSPFVWVPALDNHNHDTFNRTPP